MERRTTILGLTALLGAASLSSASVIADDPFGSEAVQQIRSQAIAQGQPYAVVVINDTVVDLSYVVTVDTADAEVELETDVETDTGNFLVAALATDQILTFGATTTNIVAGPVTYAFLFGKPISPDFYNTASLTGGVSLTNGDDGVAALNNSAIYPTYLSGYGTLGATPTNLGVDLGVGPIVAAGSPGAVTTTQNFGTIGNTFADTFYDNLEALLTYDQSGLNSVSSWSGSVKLSYVIPEPATLALLAPAVLVIATRRRRG